MPHGHERQEHYEKGHYTCGCCGHTVFPAFTKYDAGSGSECGPPPLSKFLFLSPSVELLFMKWYFTNVR